MDTQIVLVLAILGFTAVLLIVDVIRIDIVAILCLLALGWTGILEPLETLSGFASNAVITMIAVMMMGKGVARTGVMVHFSRLAARLAGKNQPRIIAIISAAIGLMSGFIQNIGAAALFLPLVLNISHRQKLPASGLIMPVGFAIVLSGTLTMIGSGPLMLANDFLGRNSLEQYGLFTVTPVGLVLLFAGIFYFFTLGKFVLPRHEAKEGDPLSQKKLIEDWQISARIWYHHVNAGSPMVGKKLGETGIWEKYKINLLALTSPRTVEYAPWRDTRFEPGHIIAILGDEKDVRKFAADYGLAPAVKPGKLDRLDDASVAGFAEVIVPPRSAITGQTLKKFGLRRRYGVEPVLLYHNGQKVAGDFSDREIVPGDIFVVHGLWDNIAEMKKNNDFIPITPVEAGNGAHARASVALLCFASAIGLALLKFPTSLSFLSGAAAMVLTGVLSIDDAYQAVNLKVVFFIAGLIPLGFAMQKTGAAALLAVRVLSLVQTSHPVLILAAISGLTTIFSLFLSNIGAAVILFPVVSSIANAVGMDARSLVLLVGVSSANSFLLPTHQVNALLKTPGGYRNKDYIKAGGGLTILFLVIVVAIFYLFYL